MVNRPQQTPRFSEKRRFTVEDIPGESNSEKLLNLRNSLEAERASGEFPIDKPLPIDRYDITEEGNVELAGVFPATRIDEGQKEELLYITLQELQKYVTTLENAGTGRLTKRVEKQILHILDAGNPAFQDEIRNAA